MKKIMFNDRYGLTADVLQGRKTMTRRIVPAQYVPMIEDGLEGAALIEAQSHGDAYRTNEIVAVSQNYNDAAKEAEFNTHDEALSLILLGKQREKGWTNKLFVKSNLMPHQIQITDINIERLQDITNEDCMKEGVYYDADVDGYKVTNLSIPNKGFRGDLLRQKYFFTPREAFATLINRPGVGRKDLWKENPFVFAYSFKLIK